eukprot:gene1808-biopygen1392
MTIPQPRPLRVRVHLLVEPVRERPAAQRWRIPRGGDALGSAGTCQGICWDLPRDLLGLAKESTGVHPKDENPRGNVWDPRELPPLPAAVHLAQRVHLQPLLPQQLPVLRREGVLDDPRRARGDEPLLLPREARPPRDLDAAARRQREYRPGGVPLRAGRNKPSGIFYGMSFRFKHGSSGGGRRARGGRRATPALRQKGAARAPPAKGMWGSGGICRGWNLAAPSRRFGAVGGGGSGVVG